MQWLPAAKCHISLCCRPAICLPPSLTPPASHLAQGQVILHPRFLEAIYSLSFPCEDVCLICPRKCIQEILSPDKYFPIHSLGSRKCMAPVLNLIWYHPFFQEVHPCSAMNIDSVKIDTSLIMAREWVEYLRRPRDQEPREISRAEGMYIVQPNPVRLEAVLAILL